MRRIISIILLVCILQLVGCSSLGAPVFSKSQTVVSPNGDEFTVNIKEYDFPDQEITIVVQKQMQTICLYAGFANYISDYDYQTDFRDGFYDVIGTYNKGEIQALRFRWGLVITIDSGNTYELIPKHLYEERKQNDDVLCDVLGQLG